MGAGRGLLPFVGHLSNGTFGGPTTTRRDDPAGGSDAQSPRPRRSTLERFNEELAILDRPLESEIEYYDDDPPSRGPRILGVTAVLVLLVGVGFVLGGPSAGEAGAAAEPAVAVAVTRPVVTTPSVEPLPSAPPPAAPAPAELAVGPPEASPEPSETTEVRGASHPRPTTARWAKLASRRAKR